MASQNWYIGGGSEPGVFAPYSPATFKGSWNSTPAASADRLLSPYKVGRIAFISKSETSATNPFRVCVVRAISLKLAPGSLTGLLDMVFRMGESNVAGNLYTKIYAYITQGDSDLVRGVVLDYTESAAGGAAEWATSAAGKAFLAAQAVGAVNYLEGDRLVVELGYSAENATTSSIGGLIYTGGCTGANISIEPAADQVVGGTTARAGFLTFSDALAISASEPTNFQVDTAIDIGTLPYDSGNLAIQSSTYRLWFSYTPAANGVIGVFPGVSDPTGVYIPAIGSYVNTGSQYDPIPDSGTEAISSVINIPVVSGFPYVFGVYGTPFATPPQGDPGRDLRVTAELAPTASGSLVGNYLITEDNANVFQGVHAFASLIDYQTGEILGLPDLIQSENGCVLDNGIVGLTEFTFPQVAPGLLMIYDIDLSVRASTNSVGISGASAIACGTDGTYFYTAQNQTTNTRILVSKVDQDGNVLQQWNLPYESTWVAGGGGGVRALAVSRDGSTLYYGTTTINRPVKRWDLVNNVALPDFVAADPAYATRDLYVLRDGSILALYWPVTSGFPLPSLGLVRRYDAAGTVLQTYSFTDPFGLTPGRTIIDHVAPTNLDPLSFAVWIQYDNAGDDHFLFYFAWVDTDTAVLSNELLTPDVLEVADGIMAPEPDVATPTHYFGASDSCPLIVMGERTTPTTARLTVVKVTDPPGASQAFEFAVGPGLSPATPSLLDGQSQVYEDIVPGMYSVEEAPVSGWTTDYDVSSGDPPDALALAAGDDVTVIVTNTLDTPPDCPGETGPPRQDGVPYVNPCSD